jgi:Spy/CpxP family protein refolding chaperone
MKLIPRAIPLAASVLLAAALGGCAATAKSDAHDHASAEATDSKSQCEMHGKMMRGKPAAEQQAMMQERMKSMSPEMRQKMQAMHERCR